MDARNYQLEDYRRHYQVDAKAIVEPATLPPVRRASEQRRLEALVRLLRLRPGERLLDIGCGSGWLAARCREAGARVWAADLALEGVAAARGRYPRVDHFQVADVYYLPFARDSFDAAVLSEVVEHLENIDAALAETRRLLKPGGRALVSVPYREVIAEHLCIHCNRLTPANAHLHSFDETRLAECLRRQGLTPGVVLRMNNKLLELAGFPRWSRAWPHWLWRGIDGLGNAVVGRPAFLCMLAFKTPE